MAESFSRQKLRQAPQKEGGEILCDLSCVTPASASTSLTSRINGMTTHERLFRIMAYLVEILTLVTAIKVVIKSNLILDFRRAPSPQEKNASITQVISLYTEVSQRITRPVCAYY